MVRVTASGPPQGKENQAGSGSKQSEVVGKGSAWGSEKEDSALGDDPRLGPENKQAGGGVDSA